MSNIESASVCFYTTPSPDYADEIVSAFERKHPGIKVAYAHDHAARFFERVLQELLEKRCPADVMLLNRQQAEALKQRGVLQPYRSPEAQFFPERAQDADGFGTQVFMVPFSLAYHTGKVSSADLPTTYEALLDPRWKGQLLFPDPRLSGSACGWYAIMKDAMGEAFLRRLGAQKLICRHRAEDRLAAGDGSVLLAAMVDRIEKLKRKGAPVDWIPMPIMMVAGPHAVLFRDAPHSEAGKLLIDFFLSEEGQTIMSRYHIPNRPGIDMRDPMFAAELQRLEGCRLTTFSSRHGTDYQINQANCVELFCSERLKGEFMQGKYGAIVIQTRVKECFNRQDVIDNLSRACRVAHTSVRHPYFGHHIQNKLVAFDTHAHNHGYSIKEMIQKIAIQIPGEETRLVSDAAQRDEVYIATSALEYDANFKDTFFTCFFIVDPNGEVIYKYRKIHTHLGTEKTLSPYDVMDRYYELNGAGKTRLETFFPVADTPIGTIATLIAHDRIYPEAARAMALNGAEILILGPQPEPTVASGRWETMNRARSFENMVYVMAANYGEFISDERVAQRWAGHSMIVDFNGQIIGSAPFPGEAVCAALIDIEALRERRADAHDSPLAELRTDLYREIYAQDIYRKNRYAHSVPGETREERLSYFPDVYQKLVARKSYVKPKT